MKKILLIFPIIISIAIFLYPSTTNSFTGGSPGGKTNSPNDIAMNASNNACNSCHYAALGSQSDVSITTNIPSSGWIPNNIYTVTASIQNTGITKFGFELTAEKSDNNNKYGTFLLTNPTETKYVNNNNAITHTSTGTQGIDSRSWSMDWQAPASIDDDVIFYAAFIAANNDGGNGGDTYYNTSIQIPANSNVSSIREGEINDCIIIQGKNLKTCMNMKHIIIYDISGKIVYSADNLRTQETIDLTYLNSNIYIIKLQDENGNLITKKINFQ